MRARRASAQAAPSRVKSGLAAGAGRFQIISNLSHELRTPLQVLNGYLDILAEDWGAELSAEPARIVERLRLSAAELTQTVENLLEYAAATTGTQSTVRETIDLSELIAELQAAFAAAARRKKIFLVWRVDPHPGVVTVDRRRLVSICANLISNAIKFTERGGVTVKLRRLRLRNASVVELEVADTGIGMDQHRLHEAFAPFVQLSASSTRRHRGSDSDWRWSDAT